AAATKEVRSLDLLDDAHRGGRRSTAARNSARGVASGSREPNVMRTSAAKPTAATHAEVMPSIQADQVSVPVPRPWTTPIGHAAYVNQWIARQVRCPMKPR